MHIKQCKYGEKLKIDESKSRWNCTITHRNISERAKIISKLK